MTIIKQNNMTYQQKIIFCIWDGFGYVFGVGTYMLVTRPIPGVIRENLNSVKTEKTRQIEFGSNE